MAITQIKNLTYNKSKISLFTKSSLIAGLSFIIIFFLAFGLRYWFTSLINNRAVQKNSQIINFLWFFALISILVSFVLTWIWNFKMMQFNSIAKINPLFTFIIYLTFIVGYGFSLSFIFCYFKMNELIFIFLNVAGLVSLTGCTSKLISFKTEMTLAKIAIIGTVVLLVLSLILLILYLCNIYNSVLSLIIMFVGALLSLIFMINDFARINRINEKTLIGSNTQQAQKITNMFMLYYAFMLLADITMLFYYLLRIYTAFKK